MQELWLLRTALIVEDDYLIAMDLRMALVRFGCESVEMVGSVSAGLERIALGGIDFATVDIRIRDLDCSPVTRALSLLRIPFIYVSGLARPDDLDAPSAPWVTKPAYDEELRLAAEAAVTGVYRSYAQQVPTIGSDFIDRFPTSHQV